MKINHFPTIIILTHRRGAAMGVLKDNSLFHLNLKELLSLIPMQSKKNAHNSIEFFDVENSIFCRVLGKTAENLYDLYRHTLALSHLKSKEIKTIVVGIGPGSFTGLRLACSFVNGLVLGHKCFLLPVTTNLVGEIFNIKEMEPFLNQFKIELDDFEINDESTGYVTFFDLMVAIHKVNLEDRQFVDSAQPEYGREPGPVLKLKEAT